MNKNNKNNIKNNKKKEVEKKSANEPEIGNDARQSLVQGLIGIIKAISSVFRNIYNLFCVVSKTQCISILFSFLISAAQTWVIMPDPIFSVEFGKCATGYSSTNNKIWILGADVGFQDMLFEYSCDDNTVTARPGILYPWSVGNRMQFWVQIGSIVYLAQHNTIDPYYGFIHTFNVDTAAFTQNYESIPIATQTDHVCLASVEDGGVDYLVSLYRGESIEILNLNTNTWFTSGQLPSNGLQTHDEGGCLTVNTIYHRLWVFGGWTGAANMPEVDYLDVSNFASIAGRSWTSSTPLPVGIKRLYFSQNMTITYDPSDMTRVRPLTLDFSENFQKKTADPSLTLNNWFIWSNMM